MSAILQQVSDFFKKQMTEAGGQGYSGAVETKNSRYTCQKARDEDHRHACRGRSRISPSSEGVSGV